MERRRTVVGTVVGVGVCALLLGAIAWMVYQIVGQRPGDGVTRIRGSLPPRAEDVGDRRRPPRDPLEGLEVASVPWDAARDPRAITPISVMAAVLPWDTTREAAVATGKYLPAEAMRAIVPRIPVRHDPKSPAPALVVAAKTPWSAERLAAGGAVRAGPVYVEQAHVPRIAIHRDLRRPDPATVAVAETPWSAARDPRRPAAVHVETAHVSRSRWPEKQKPAPATAPATAPSTQPATR